MKLYKILNITTTKNVTKIKFHIIWNVTEYKMSLNEEKYNKIINITSYEMSHI